METSEIKWHRFDTLNWTDKMEAEFIMRRRVMSLLDKVIHRCFRWLSSYRLESDK